MLHRALTILIFLIIPIGNCEGGADTVFGPLHELRVPDVPLLSSVFSSDQKKVYAVGNGIVAVFDVETGAEIDRIPQPSPDCRTIALSPNDKLMAVGAFGYGSSGQVVFLWDVASETLLHTFEHANPNGHPDFSDDGRLLLTGGSNLDNHLAAKVWNTSDFALVSLLVRPPEVHGGSVSDLQFARQPNQIVVGYNDHKSIVWRIQDELEFVRYPGNMTAFYNSVDLAISGATTGCTPCSDTLVLRNSRTYIQTEEFDEISQPVGLEISPDDTRLLVLTSDGYARLISLESKASMGSIKVFEYFGYPSGRNFSPDGSMVTLTRGGGGGGPESPVKLYTTGIKVSGSRTAMISSHLLGAGRLGLDLNSDELIDAADLAITTILRN